MKLGKETPLEHLTTFLMNKYGLPRLVEENRQSILRWVEEHKERSAMVGVFYHTLANGIDEDFRFVIPQLHNTLDHLVHAYLRGQFTSESEGVVMEKKKAITEGGKKVREEIWREAITFMYNPQDRKRVAEAIRAKIEEERQKIEEHRSVIDKKTKVSRTEKTSKEIPMISYPSLLKTLQDFQLVRHIEYLQPFSDLFAECALPLPSLGTQSQSGGEGGPEAEGRGDGESMVEVGAEQEVEGETSQRREKVKEDEEGESGTLKRDGENSFTPIHSGRIDEEGFILLFRKIMDVCELDVDEQRIQTLLNRIDPYSTKLFTYTECFRVMSEEIERLHEHVEAFTSF
jgi:hypothetical protein